jgi:DNA mismatch repair protein MutL
MALFLSAQPSGEKEVDDRFPETGSSSLNQFHETFIVATTSSGVVIIDQHAAHERIVFEELMDSFTHGDVAVQRLLFPITVSVTHQEESILQEYGSLLAKFGFDIEPFGERMYLIQTVPAIEPGYDVEESFHTILGDLSEQGGHEKNQYERIARVIACRTAIKAGVPLHEEQMTEIVDRLFACELPYSDIHGRATIVEISLDELNRRFGRS